MGHHQVDDTIIPVVQLDAHHATGRQSHRPHLLFLETDRPASSGDQQHLIRPCRNGCPTYRIPLLDPKDDELLATHARQIGQGDPLHDAIVCGEEQVALRLRTGQGQGIHDSVTASQRRQIGIVGARALPRHPLRQLVDRKGSSLAIGGEEIERVLSGGTQQRDRPVFGPG